jgi:apolipoprotein N-acyltransferase
MGCQRVLATRRRTAVSFLLYIIGFIVFIAGLAWLATALGLSQTYIMIGAVILLGIGIFTAATRTRAKDPPAA